MLRLFFQVIDVEQLGSHQDDWGSKNKTADDAWWCFRRTRRNHRKSCAWMKGEEGRWGFRWKFIFPDSLSMTREKRRVAFTRWATRKVTPPARKKKCLTHTRRINIDLVSGGSRLVYFPTSSRTLRLSNARSRWLSTLAIWIIFLSRWKVRSMDSGGSSLRFSSSSRAALTTSSSSSSSSPAGVSSSRRGSWFLLWRAFIMFSPRSSIPAALRSLWFSRCCCCCWGTRSRKLLLLLLLSSSQPGRERGLPAAGRRCQQRRAEERSSRRETGFMSCGAHEAERPSHSLARDAPLYEQTQFFTIKNYTYFFNHH